tara:strand:+ start:4103 stop:6631 length:2529 start_codon:yes stop_codon:yes gene_type:complete
MSIKNCISVIKGANKSGSITDEAAMEMLEEIDDFITAKKAQGIDNIEGELAKHIAQRNADTQFANIIDKRNKAINAMTEARALNYVSTFDDPHQGLMALMGGIVESKNKSKLSIDVQGKSLANKYIGKLIDRIEQDGDLKAFNSGKLDSQVAAELWELKPGGKPGVSGSPAAKRVAEHIHAMQEIGVKNSNNAGSFIRSMPGYIMRQSHDMTKIRKMGQEQWIDFVIDKLDPATFKGANPRKFLEGAYKGLATGVHRRFKDVDPHASNHIFGFTGPANLAKKASAERLLHFKSSEDFMTYNKALGTGDLREGIVHGLEHLGRNTALMRGLGTNPVAMLDKLKKRFITDAQKDGNVELTDKFGDNKLENLMAEIDGTTRVPVKITVARVNAGLRAIANLSKLGGATVSSITDIPNQAAELRYQGHHPLKGFSNAFASLFRGRGSAQQRSIARGLGIGFDGVTGDLMSRFHANDHIPGLAAKAQQKFFKLNLMSWWNDSHRTGMGLMMSNSLARDANLSYADLGKRLQNVLQQYGIKGQEWDIIRAHTVKEAGDGNTYITSDGLQNVPDDILKNYLKAKQKPTGKRAIQDLKDELEAMVDSFFMDRADHGIPMPGARERAMMNQGTRAGTAQGEMFRHFMQFKSFPITMIRRGMGREIYGQADGKADISGLAQLMVGAAVFGYGAMYAKDMLKGRSPREFNDDYENNSKIIFGALAQGGGFGIYGDFLFGEYSRYGTSFLSSLAGPTIGQVDAVAELWTKARKGEDFGATLLAIGKNNTPFINLFYTRMALDYMFLYQLQEMTNPGYLSRLEQRIMTENNQEFYMPPSKSIPYGGGNKLLEGIR